MIRELDERDDMSKRESPLIDAEPGVGGPSRERRGAFSRMIATSGRYRDAMRAWYGCHGNEEATLKLL